jgi:hypothetical protein
VPPITAAAIAFSRVSDAPDDWLTANSREAARMPPAAARVEARVNTTSRTLSTRMPARRAASALPPTARTCLPNRVRLISRSTSATRPVKITNASGRPRSAASTAAAAKAPAVRTTIRVTIVRSGGMGSPAATRRRRLQQLGRRVRGGHQQRSSQAYRGMKKVLASPTMVESVRFTVPVSPSTRSSAPSRPAGRPG